MKTRIVIHATDTLSDLRVTIEDIESLKSQDRYADPLPYHYIVNVDGSILKCKKDRELCGHCGRFSRDSFSVAYAGGINSGTGLPANTLNAEQDKTLRYLIAQLKQRIDGLEVTGANALLHPDEPLSDNEPYFDVAKWLSDDKK